jgi:putative membrane protein
MKKLLSNIVSAGLGLWLASMFVQGVEISVYPISRFFGFALTAEWQIFLVLGIVLGSLNYFLKPLLKLISLPLEIVTLGLFTIVINIGILWLLTKMFDEIQVIGFLAFLYTTLIIWILNLIISKTILKKEE